MKSNKPRLRPDGNGGFSMATRDGLVNLYTGLGTGRDSRTGGTFEFGTYQDYVQYEAAYSENWIARDIIDIPVDDATREWREFQHAQADQIMAEEKRLGIQQRFQEGVKWARLYGGAVMVMLTDQALDKPLDVNKIKKGSLKAIRVIDRMYITGQDWNYTDILAENYMLPSYYLLYGGAQRIHFSHLVRMPGAMLPMRLRQLNGMWDDSEMRRCLEDLKDVVESKGGIAKLIQTANVDTVTVEGLKSALASGDTEKATIDRFRVFNLMKSAHSLALLDSKEEFDRKGVSFGGLGDILSVLMTWISGAAHIPMTRLFGIQAKGLGNGGEGDMNNYYNSLRGKQEGPYRQVLEKLDQVFIRSALGSFPDDYEFQWKPLDQPDGLELAQTRMANAQADDLRIQQGVPAYLVMQKLNAAGEFDVPEDLIKQMEANHNAQAQGEAADREPVSITGGDKADPKGGSGVPKKPA
ncbi:DUF1073 domain-containing protein [Pseudomonas sp. dw_358]|uniref:DUF1073 domain-containing protein n=1 Tax=Pseudomonas sp. dw_358 TaxID=2720083 RepID=UPI0021171053|nr:DUF1073 domain-containing protein [Pseudomonas sp. dw_358]